MNRNQTSKIIRLAALLLAGFLSHVAVAENQMDRAISIQSTNSCAGTYYAIAKMTNSSGTYWITPPVNMHTGTFKDLSGFPTPYSSAVSVTRKVDQKTWCTNNMASGVTFPATNSSYTMTVYVTSSGSPPTNGQPLTLQVTWQ